MRSSDYPGPVPARGHMPFEGSRSCDQWIGLPKGSATDRESSLAGRAAQKRPVAGDGSHFHRSHGTTR